MDLFARYLQAVSSPRSPMLRHSVSFFHHLFGMQDVITTLVKHGRQTFAELRHLSKIPTEALRTALVVLIQQNCVSVYLHSSENNRKTEQLYEASIDRMLQIIR